MRTTAIHCLWMNVLRMLRMVRMRLMIMGDEPSSWIRCIRLHRVEWRRRKRRVERRYAGQSATIETIVFLAFGRKLSVKVVSSAQQRTGMVGVKNRREPRWVNSTTESVKTVLNGRRRPTVQSRSIQKRTKEGGRRWDLVVGGTVSVFCMPCFELVMGYDWSDQDKMNETSKGNQRA